jgi:hypothetical protein
MNRCSGQSVMRSWVSLPVTVSNQSAAAVVHAGVQRGRGCSKV